MGDLRGITRGSDGAGSACAKRFMARPVTARRPARVGLERIPYHSSDWEATIGVHPDLEVFRGSAWLDYLARPEEEIHVGMRPRTRRHLRKAVRQGLRPEVATGLDFADAFYEQLVEVFAHQGLVPRYGVERGRRLITALQPMGQLLLVRIAAPEGRCVASGVSVGRNRTAMNWGAAFFRADSELHPNEVLWWEAMRYWRSRGARRYDMGGGGDYKAEYGGVETPTFHFHRSRYSALRYGRSAVRSLFRARQVLAGRRARDVPGHGPA